MSKTNILLDLPVTTAADLKKVIERLELGGFDLTRIGVTNGDGDKVGSMELAANDAGTLSLSFWLG